MDYLWTPWRYRYIASEQERLTVAYFCDAAGGERRRGNSDRFSRRKNFIILNRYPYTSGHVMVVPYAHVADLASADPETLAEMMQLAQRVQMALEKTYHPRRVTTSA